MICELVRGWPRAAPERLIGGLFNVVRGRLFSLDDFSPLLPHPASTTQAASIIIFARELTLSLAPTDVGRQLEAHRADEIAAGRGDSRRYQL